MIVYRVQDKDGVGAYAGWAGTAATDLLGPEEYALAGRPGPQRDFEQHTRRWGTWFFDGAYKFAFPSVEAAYRWFPYPAMVYLEARGFFLQAVEADVVLRSDSGEQVMYRVLPPEPEAGDVRGLA